MELKAQVADAENVVLVCTGGIGRNIMATAVVRNVKKAFPDKDLIVVATCPDVFLKNPHIRRVIHFGQAMYFYEDYIQESKSVVINVEAYTSFDYVYKRKHFVQSWCDMIGVPCDAVMPELFFTKNEKRMAKLYLEQFDREMVLFQHDGGKAPEDKSEKAQITAKAGMYRRSLPKDVVDGVTDGLIERGFMVGSFQHENQYCPTKAENIKFPIRAVLGLLLHVPHVIGIDSCLIHGAAAVHKKALVLWGGTSPAVLGYEFHENMTRRVCDTPMCHRPNSYLFDVQPTGFLWECPHDDACMNYEAAEILESFDRMTGGARGKRRDEAKGSEASCGRSCEESKDIPDDSGPETEAGEDRARVSADVGTDRPS